MKACEKFCLLYCDSNNKHLYYIMYNKNTSGFSSIHNIIKRNYEIAIMSKNQLEKIIKKLCQGNKKQLIKFEIINPEIFYNEYNMHAALS